jgi:uncharacterized protein with GYD domain
MGTYIVLTTLNGEGRKGLKEDPSKIKEHNHLIEALGIKIRGQYATLGQYDFINIFEAEDETAIYKAAVQLSGRGIHQTVTLPAKTLDDFIKATSK